MVGRYTRFLAPILFMSGLHGTGCTNERVISADFTRDPRHLSVGVSPKRAVASLRRTVKPENIKVGNSKDAT